jgi:hypothetical protein
VLTNPRSGGNKKGIGTIREFLAKHPNVFHFEARNPAEIESAVAEFAHRKVELIVVNGGDGTAHAMFTALYRLNAFVEPPLIALLQAGTSSMLARDVGLKGNPVAGLRRILHWARTGTGCTILGRPILKIIRGGELEPLYGMFFGGGAICQGIKLFHRSLNPQGWRGELMPGLILLKMLLGVIRKDQKLVPPIATNTSLDGGPSKEVECLFVLMSTLERLFLGLRPYWGTEPGTLHFTMLAAAHPYLLRSLPFLLLGRKNKHAARENGYISHNANKVHLAIDGDFTVDGELYTTQVQRPLLIQATNPVLFLH